MSSGLPFSQENRQRSYAVRATKPATGDSFNDPKSQLRFDDEASECGMLNLQPVVSGDGKAVRWCTDCRELAGANAEPVLTLLLQFLNRTSVLLEVMKDSPAKTASGGSCSFIMVTR